MLDRKEIKFQVELAREDRNKTTTQYSRKKKNRTPIRFGNARAISCFIEKELRQWMGKNV